MHFDSQSTYGSDGLILTNFGSLSSCPILKPDFGQTENLGLLALRLRQATEGHFQLSFCLQHTPGKKRKTQ